MLDLLAMLPGKVLLITYKQAEAILRPDLPPHVEVAHFGALRGLNAYERCETAVVMGREQPSAQPIEALTRPFCATDAEPFIPIGEYVLQSRGRRMRNGGPNVAEVQVHPDSRCQAMLEQVREAEIAQAVDRVRPVFNRRRIIVLTNLALDLTIDHTLTWPELRPGKFAYAFTRHGVLPLSAGDLCRGFPDLWRLENTAKVELSRAGFYANEKGVHFPNNIFIWSLYPILTARYRRRNQRGPAARALIDAALPDPRAVLESLVGELTEFHLERRAAPPPRPKPGPHRIHCRPCPRWRRPCPPKGTCSHRCRRTAARLTCSAWPASSSSWPWPANVAGQNGRLPHEPHAMSCTATWAITSPNELMLRRKAGRLAPARHPGRRRAGPAPQVARARANPTAGRQAVLAPQSEQPLRGQPE